MLTIVHPGQLFAEAVMFLEEGKFPASAIALETCEVIGFENKILTNYLRESHELSMMMLSNLSRKLHKQIPEIDSLTMQNANYRLLNFINSLIPLSEVNVAEVELSGPKSAIASRLSITPETFSHSLHSLSEQNIISPRGRGRIIDIPDIEKFRTYLHTH